MTTPSTKALDEVQIRQLIADRGSAVCAKDLDRIMSFYARDVVFFDCKPPFQTRGAEAFRRIWETCLPLFPASCGMESRDLRIFVGGDLAFAHWLYRFASHEKDHAAMQTWLRTTVGYRRNQGKWQIVHEHGSVPFNPETRQAVFTLEP
jgi:uncharacterized protein (TIGR02246 family)